MKKKWYLILSYISLCIAGFLTGCKHGVNELDSMNSTFTTAIGKVPEESDLITSEVGVKTLEEPEPVMPEVTITPTASNETIPGETLAKELSNDIDHNGITDLVQIMEREMVLIMFESFSIIPISFNMNGTN